MDIATVIKLYGIFDKNKWHKNDGHDIVFENFCKLLLNLSEEQRCLLLELTERYLWITFSEYNSRLLELFEKIEQEKINVIRKIVLFPIMRPEDVDKTKSGHIMLYAAKGIKPMLNRYKDIEFNQIESFENISQTKFSLKDGEYIFLLDDYLGSGETIKSTIEMILKNRSIAPSKLNVLSIAAQKDSIDFLDQCNISYYIHTIRNKGISDYYEEPELREKIRIMEEIEKLIPNNHFKFGYNESEALITLIKTPDNTFPIFWKEHKKDSVKYDAPFSRY
jgi:hypoxanthine-guanine phosphoribosyltransferase